jgi:multiple sugar transport system substrate-binding protein
MHVEEAAIGPRLSRRRALHLLGIGASGALLAACAPPAPPASTQAPAGATPVAPPAQQAPAQAAQRVSLRWFFWTGSEEERQFWEDLAADASQALGNIEVKFETDSFDNFWTKLPTYAASNTLADILGLQSLRTATFSRSLYLPLDDFITNDKGFDLSDFSRPIVDGLSYQGKLYALSYDFGPYVVYYNKTLFQKAGVPFPKEDWTWQDFLDTARALTKDIDGKPVAGMVSSNQFDRVVPWILSNGGDYANADFTKSQLSAPPTAEAIQFYVDLLRTEKVEPEISDPGNSNADRDQFVAGRAAMYVSGPWQFINTRSKLKDDWDITLFPRGKAGSIVQVAGSGFGISTSTKNKDQAWQVVKRLTSTESLKKVAAAGRGYPGRESAVSAFYRKDLLPEHQQLIGKQLQTAKAYRTNPTWQEATTRLTREFLDPMLIEGRPVSDAVKSAEPMFQELIDKGLQQG